MRLQFFFGIACQASERARKKKKKKKRFISGVRGNLFFFNPAGRERGCTRRADAQVAAARLGPCVEKRVFFWHLEKFCAQLEAEVGGRAAAGRGRRAAEPVPSQGRAGGKERRRMRRGGGWVAFLVPPPVPSGGSGSHRRRTQAQADRQTCLLGVTWWRRLGGGGGEAGRRARPSPEA